MKKILNILKEKKKIIIPSILIMLFGIALIIILNNNNTLANNNGDLLELSCPNTVSPGASIECTISLTTNSIKGMGFQATIESSEGLTDWVYENNETNNNWTLLSSSSNAIVYYNQDGITGTYTLGTLKYKVPDDANANEVFYVSLKEIILAGDDENNETKDVPMDDLIVGIRVLSNTNTLEEISLSVGSLNETFNSEVYNYTANVDSDKVYISVIKTDESSKVDGVGYISLHYGTNDIVITVTGEDKSENKYTISIKREYEFTSDNYIYNKEKNYIYTKMDNVDTIKSNINNLPNGLTSVVEDNKLIIKYDDEELISINIINLSSSKYSISGNKIRIGENVSYKEFIENITTNGVTIKLYDGDNEITSDTLKYGDKLKVYYEDTLLAEYTVVLENLSFDDNLIVDDINNNKMIKRIKAGTTYGELKNNITTSGTITIYNGKDNTKLSDSDKVKTGDILEIKLQDGTIKYTISVLGDISGAESKSGKVLGDGEITVGDVSQLYRYLKGKTEFEDYQLSAGDILSDGNIKVNDVARLYRYIRGINKILEVK